MSAELDRIMAVMATAFEPEWGEAWTRRQVGDSLAFPSTHARIIGIDGSMWSDCADAAGFTLVRAAPGEEELLLVAVAPSARGRGLGSALIEDAVKQARMRGAETMFLEMRENNPARALYERHGFAPIGRRRDYYRRPDGSRIDAITFSRPISIANGS